MTDAAAPVLVENHDYPYVVMQLYFGGGSALDPPGKEGLAYLTGQMLLRGTKRLPQRQFTEAVDLLGSSLEVSVGREWVLVEGDALSRHLDAWLALTGEALAEPRFAEDELARLRRQTIAEIEELRDSDEDLAQYFFYQVLYQPDPSARPIKGTASSLANITVDDVRDAYRRTFCRENLMTGFAGDVQLADLAGALDRSLPLPAGEAQPRVGYIGADPGKVRVTLIDKPERTQSQIYIGHQGISASHPDYYPLLVANTVYGGTFTARLSAEIREKRGWSYGAYSYMPVRRTSGAFLYRFYPAAKDTIAALGLGLQMQRTLCEDGVSQDEVEFARSYLVSHFPFRLQTPKRRLDETMHNRLLDLPEDTTERYTQRVGAVTREAANAAVRRQLKYTDLDVVMVCTAEPMREAIEAMEEVDDVSVFAYDSDWPHPG